MLRTAFVVPVLAALVLTMAGCAGTHNQRYFLQPQRAHAVEANARLEIRFVRQSVREVVALVRLTNQGQDVLTVAPTGPVASWTLAIAGRTLPLAEQDRTYWSAWSGTTSRDKSPLKVVRDLAPGESIDIEVRWRLEPAVADPHAPWVLTAANLRRGAGAPFAVAVSFPSAESAWSEPPEQNPNRIMRPGQRGWTNVRPWNTPILDDETLVD